MFKSFAILTFFALGLVVSQSAQASFIFEIQTLAGSTPQTEFNLGDTVTVRLVAVDTAGGPVDFSAVNMRSFGARVLASTTDPNDALPLAAPTTINSSFTVGQFTSGTDFSTGGVIFSGGTPGSTGFVAASSQTLAQFTYVVSSPVTTNFSFDPAFGNNAAFVGLPNQAPASFVSASVSVVPEPSCLMLLGLTAVGFGFRRSRHGRAK